jgi:hypothetical protein
MRHQLTSSSESEDCKHMVVIGLRQQIVTKGQRNSYLLFFSALPLLFKEHFLLSLIPHMHPCH